MGLKLQAKVTFREGMHFRADNHNDQGVELDSRPAGVIPAGPAPMELVLQAVGGCTAMDVVYILRMRKLEPEQFEVNVTGVKRDTHPKVFDEINITYRAKGPGITVRELERAAGLSLKTYCSVSAMLKGTTKIDYRCEMMT